MTSFKVIHGELQLQAHFKAPIFDLLDPPASRLHAALYSGLSKFGISLNDVKLVVGVPNLSEASVSYHLLNLNAMVRLSLDKLEVFFFDTTKVAREEILAVYEVAFTALGQIVNGLEIREYDVVIALHALPEDRSLMDFWSILLPKVPTGLGPASGQGVVFYYGANEKMTGSSVVLDMSLRVSNGLFFKTNMNFDGTKVTTTELSALVQDAFVKVSSNLDMKLT